MMIFNTVDVRYTFAVAVLSVARKEVFTEKASGDPHDPEFEVQNGSFKAERRLSAWIMRIHKPVPAVRTLSCY
jgi:hypothetical protein